MPHAADFRIVRCQASLFTPRLQFRAAKVIGYLLAEYGERFDGDPVSIPAVPGIPRDVPQVILRGTEGGLTLQAGPARLDIIRDQDPINETAVTEFFQLATEIGGGYLKAQQGTAGRIACVLQRVVPDPTPAATLARHFCQTRWLERPLNRPGEFELHAHKRFRLDDLFEINSWVRCKTAALAKGETQPTPSRDLILVEQDLNSLAEMAETRELSADEIRQFYAIAPREMRHILDLYFPPDR